MPINSFENYPMSWKPELDKSKKPLYRMLADKMEEDIQTGNLLQGTKLPPQRELADYLELNLSTITKAFKECEKRGLLSANVGSGTYVQYGAATHTNLLPKSEGKIEMGAIIPESSSYDIIKSLVKEMTTEDMFGEWFGYASPVGVSWQKEVAQKLIAKSGYRANTQNILFTNGGQNAIAAILGALFKSGDRIGTNAFTFPGVKAAASMYGISLVPIGNELGELKEEDIIYACKNENIKAIYIIPDYHNPTTYMMPESIREMVAETSKKMDIIIIEDAIYNLLCERSQKAVASYAPERTFHITSLSKAFAPGLRMAYLVTPDKYYTKISDALYSMNISVSPFMAELSSRLLASEKATELLHFHRMEARKRNNLVNKYFGQYQCLGDDESIFRWLILPVGIKEEEFAWEADKQGVVVFTSRQFAVGTTKPINAVRLGIGTPNNLEKLEQGLKILHEILIGKVEREIS